MQKWCIRGAYVVLLVLDASANMHSCNMHKNRFGSPVINSPLLSIKMSSRAPEIIDLTNDHPIIHGNRSTRRNYEAYTQYNNGLYSFDIDRIGNYANRPLNFGFDIDVDAIEFQIHPREVYKLGHVWSLCSTTTKRSGENIQLTDHPFSLYVDNRDGRLNNSMICDAMGMKLSPSTNPKSLSAVSSNVTVERIVEAMGALEVDNLVCKSFGMKGSPKEFIEALSPVNIVPTTVNVDFGVERQVENCIPLFYEDLSKERNFDIQFFDVFHLVPTAHSNLNQTKYGSIKLTMVENVPRVSKVKVYLASWHAINKMSKNNWNLPNSNQSAKKMVSNIRELFDFLMDGWNTDRINGYRIELSYTGFNTLSDAYKHAVNVHFCRGTDYILQMYNICRMDYPIDTWMVETDLMIRKLPNFKGRNSINIQIQLKEMIADCLAQLFINKIWCTQRRDRSGGVRWIRDVNECFSNWHLEHPWWSENVVIDDNRFRRLDDLEFETKYHQILNGRSSDFIDHLDDMKARIRVHNHERGTNGKLYYFSSNKRSRNFPTLESLCAHAFAEHGVDWSLHVNLNR